MAKQYQQNIFYKDIHIDIQCTSMYFGLHCKLGCGMHPLKCSTRRVYVDNPKQTPHWTLG